MTMGGSPSVPADQRARELEAYADGLVEAAQGLIDEGNHQRATSLLFLAQVHYVKASLHWEESIAEARTAVAEQQRAAAWQEEEYWRMKNRTG